MHAKKHPLKWDAFFCLKYKIKDFYLMRIFLNIEELSALILAM